MPQSQHVDNIYYYVRITMAGGETENFNYKLNDSASAAATAQDLLAKVRIGSLFESIARRSPCSTVKGVALVCECSRLTLFLR